MSIKSDLRHKPILKVAAPGPGLRITRTCNKCLKPSGIQTGSGMRMIMGQKRWVCGGCVVLMDAKGNSNVDQRKDTE